MTCASCLKANLPGGARCVYCGIPFPSLPDFDFGEGGPSRVGAASEGSSDAGPQVPPKRGVSAGLLVGLFLFLFKWKSLLTLAKAFPVLGSMLLFIWADAQLFGWQLGTGVGVSILIHELGHVVMNRRHGLKFSAPMFIPFVGAVIAVKQFPADPKVEAECGAGGPAAGLLAAVACVGIGHVTNQPVWMSIAFLGFAINLFNMVPFWQLDGARIFSAIGPGNWNFILIALFLIVLKAPSAIVWVFLVLLFLLRLGRTQEGRHNLALPIVRARIAVVYLGLLLALAYGAEHTRSAHEFISQARAAAPLSRSLDAGPALEEHEVSQPAPPASSGARPARGRTSPPGWVPALMWVLGSFALLLSVVVLGVVALAWPLTASWLARAAGERLRNRGRNLIAAMFGVLAALGAFTFWGLNEGWLSSRDALELGGAYLAGMFAALAFAGYHVTHAAHQVARPPHHWLTWRCLGWTAAGALAVAYAVENLWVVAAVALCVAVFYAQRPWLLPSLAARWMEGFGYSERAIALRERALGMKPHPEVLGDLYDGLTRSYLKLGHGDRVLDTLSRATNHGPQPDPASFAALMRACWRALGLVRTERFGEALAQCEEILRAPQGDRAGKLRVLLVREILAELALHRGWPEEARSQAEVVLRETPSTAGSTERSLIAGARWVRALAMATEGRSDEALRETERALQWGREPEAEVSAALVRARTALARGERDEALREVQGALKRLPGHLEARYQQAVLLRENGAPEGMSQLAALARQYPHDRWGRLAAAAHGDA